MSELNVPTLVGALLTDLPCRKCGYNLRGLDGAGRCPECGTPVGYSVQGDLLKFSDPNWLRGLRVGINLILVSIAALIASIVLLVAFVRSAGDQSALQPILTIITQVLIFVGTWKLTESDPSGLGEQDYGRVRRFIRIALLVGLAGTVLGLVTSRLELPDTAATALSVVQLLAGLLGIGGFCCQLVYLSRLARRLPDETLARKARSIGWMIGLSYSFVLIFAFIVGMAARWVRAGAPAITSLGCGSAIAGIVLLVAFIRYLLLIERFAKQLKVEEAHARAIWATSPATIES